MGMPYGATNRRGLVSPVEVQAILRQARRDGVDLLDTAAAYGESETVLGAQGAVSLGFHIVSKLPPALAPQDVPKAVERSLARLGAPSLYALLAHHAHDVLGIEGKERWQGMRAVQSKGSAQRLGVSVYHPEELDAVLAQHAVDVVQIPFNVLDQRWLNDGRLERLSNRGIEIHVRSVFLQGTLLVKPEALTGTPGLYKAVYERFHQACREAGASPLSACLSYALSYSSIARVVVGVTALSEWNDIAQAALRPVRLDWSSLACHDEKLLIPSAWEKQA